VIKADVVNESVTSDGTADVTALLRLAASGGRSDRLRIVLTAIGSASATTLVLAAMSVVFISERDGPYRIDVLDQPGLRPGVIVALLLLCVPLVVFVGLCTRVGAPARDRRLAMLRMAGATPADTTRIAALETGVAGLLGAVVGTVVFFVGRTLLDGTTTGEFTVTMPDGSIRAEVGATRLLPTDVLLPFPAVLAVIAAISLGATAASVGALRKVRISPFGVTRKVPSRPPTVTAALLFLVGSGGLIVFGAAARFWTGNLPILVFTSLVLFMMCVAGLLMGGASLSAAVGRFLAPRTSRADVLIASRRMVDAPYASSRAAASILLSVLLGAAILGTRANFLAQQDPSDTFYADIFDLLNYVCIAAIMLSAANLVVTSSEAIVERRRTLAALAASGTPRSVLARAVIMESLIPLVPTVVVAVAAGVFTAWSFFGTTVQRLKVFEVNGGDEMITVGVPIPWEQLFALGGGAIALSLIATAISLVFLRASTSPSEFRRAA
jgi:hypothetical protein